MEFKKNLKYTIIGVIALLIIAMVTAGDTVITNTGMTSDTLDTGQGANELYDMDQDVLTSSSPTFGGGTYNGRIQVTQTNDDKGLDIDSTATSDGKFAIDVTANGGAYPYKFRYNDNQTVYGESYGGRVMKIYRNIPSASTTQTVLNVVQDNAGDDQPALKVQNDGTGEGLLIDQNGNAKGLYIESAAISGGEYGIRVETGSGAYPFMFNIGNTSQYVNGEAYGKHALKVYRNVPSASTTDPVMLIKQDNTGDDQPALQVRNDGTGDSISIAQNGNTCAINVDADATCDSGTKIGEDNNIALCLVCS